MNKTPFETIWKRIVGHQSEKFYTKRELEFTYKVMGKGFYPSRTNYRLSKSNFEKAYQMVPITGPGKINWIVRGPAYIWAVLHDTRVSLGEW